ncbi:GNAT family N-acetyltransferase [Luedemannella helvata]|uniref:N-acetyltransferase domain-containing protein n=1 Tax=Luedemannella helvata TaxID=349315 RepID=A0ABN2KT22_9ACTN
MSAPKRVDLVPMTAEEYPLYLEKLIIEYAAENVTSGRWSAGESVAKSRENVLGILPDGLATAGQHLWTARDPATGARVGLLWLEIRPAAGTTEAFINDIEVDAPHRGAGYGRAIMTACDDKARELGATRVALHVHGHNTVARKLYASLGFTEKSITMAREL